MNKRNSGGTTKGVSEFRIRIAGLGGQGIVKMGIILGMAASLYGGKEAVQTQSYGPASRGGVTSSEVIISEKEINFVKVTESDVLIALSKLAYEKYLPKLKKGGVLIYDPDLVQINQGERSDVEKVPVHATKLAEELGNKLVANTLLLGVFTKLFPLINKEAVEKAIIKNTPVDFKELNLKAFNVGYKIGEKIKKH